MYRFALSRRWLLAHTAVLAFAGLCILAATWQVHRMTERRLFNRTLAAHAREPAEPLGSLVGGSTPPRGAAYRRATASGTYDAGHEIFLEGRSRNGRAGRDVLTPLVLQTGVAVLVDRGWIPVSNAPIPEAEAPAGTVGVTGILLPGRHGLGASRPQAGPQPGVTHIDLEKLGVGLPYRLVPLYVQLQSQSPPQPGELPAPMPVEPKDAGQNLSYAVQWIIFATIAVVGYAFFLRAAARRHARMLLLPRSTE
jgi:cytochrome oxidase assembly protein ShyY1